MDGYVRVSQVRGRSGESFISPDVQREQIHAWAKLHKVEIAQVHVDLDQSGGKTSRPGFDEMMRRVEQGATGGVVVAKLDRFFRSTAAGLEAIRRIEEAGARFVAIQEGVDPTTPMGKAMLSILLAMAQLQLDLARENWATAQQRAVARGIHISSATPTGYVRREDGRLEPHPVFAKEVRELFERRAAGASWRQLAAYLDDKQVEGPYGAINWRTRAVTNIISNPVYTGEARCGEFVNRDAHEAIVDRATWAAAQIAHPSPPSRGEPALLAGLLRCAGCRHVMRPDRMTLQTGPRAGERVRTYRCRGEHASGTCTNRSAVLGTVIEPYVEQQFLEAARAIAARGEADNGELGELTDAVAVAEAELSAYRDDERILAALGPDRFVEGLEVRVERLEQAQRALAEATAQRTTFADRDANLVELWPELSTEERRKLMRSAIDAVVLRRGRQVPITERALILWRGEAPDDLPRRGLRRGPLRPFDWPTDETPAKPRLTLVQ